MLNSFVKCCEMLLKARSPAVPLKEQTRLASSERFHTWPFWESADGWKGSRRSIPGAAQQPVSSGWDQHLLQGGC